MGRHRRAFLRHGFGRRRGNGLADPGFAHGDYWPLTIVPSVSRPKRSRPWMMTVGALIALSAEIIFAFRHGNSLVVSFRGASGRYR